MRIGLLEGVFRLPVGVLLKVEALGLRVPARIGTTSVLITTPGIRSNAPGPSTLVGPTMTIPSPGVNRERGSEEGFAWGRLVNRAHDRPLAEGDAYVGAIAISRILPDAGEDTAAFAETASRNLHEQIDGWWGSVADWIEVLAGQDLHRRNSGLGRPGHDLNLWLNYGGPGGALDPQPWPVVDDRYIAANRKTWQGALHAASERRHPPTEHLLLRDCLRADRAEDRRRAVVNAATAAEMALGRLLDQTLSGERPEIVAYIKGRSEQLGGHVSALAKLGVDVPAGLIEGLVEPRDRVMHDDVEPDVETARTACALAERVVELAWPRASLL